jgi:hypothetical protein
VVVRVSDTASHRRDQIANLAELFRNPNRQRLVKAIYFGKKRNKSVPFLAKKLGISTKRVTEIGKPLVNQAFAQEKALENGKRVTVYVKDEFVQHVLRESLRLANDRKIFDAYHTKTNPNIMVISKTFKLTIPFKPRTRSVTIDDVKEFAKARSVQTVPTKLKPPRLPERTVKRGIVKILGEQMDPKDWGRESNDVFTTRITVAGSRRRAAFALKGPAKTGPLVPKMMGKNGDQIQRLFTSPAQVFFVQYEGEIKESVLQQMSQLALAKAATGERSLLRYHRPEGHVQTETGVSQILQEVRRSWPAKITRNNYWLI